MMKKVMYSLAIGAVLGGNAFGYSHVHKHTLSWDDFVAHCQDPTKFGHQQQQRDIVVKCERKFKYWTSEPVQMRLPNSVKLTMEVDSSKASVNKQHVHLDNTSPDSAESYITCNNARKVVETVRAKRRVTCDDINAYIRGTGTTPTSQSQVQTQTQNQTAQQSKKTAQKPKNVTLADYCSDIVEEERQNNPDAVKVDRKDKKLIFCDRKLDDVVRASKRAKNKVRDEVDDVKKDVKKHTKWLRRRS